MKNLIVRGGAFAAASLFALTPLLADELLENGRRMRHVLDSNVSSLLTTGELTGDGLPDVACIMSGELVIFHNPATFEFPFTPTNTVHSEGTESAVVVQKGAGPGGIDRVLTTDDYGLVGWALVPSGPAFARTELAGTASLANAAALSMDDVDGDGVAELLALSANRQSLQIWHANSTNGFTAGVTYTSQGGAILKTVVAEWDATNPGKELVVVRMGGLVAVDMTTMIELGSPISFIGDAEEAILVNEGSQGQVAVAVLEMRSSGGQQLSIWRPSGGFELGVDLGLSASRGLTSADVNMDGYEDIVFISTYNPTFAVLFNLSGQPGNVGASFTANSMLTDQYAEVGLDLTNQLSPVACEDIDGDGDADLVLACQASGKLSINLNGVVVTESLIRPEGCITFADDGNSWELGGSIDLNPAFPFDEFTHIEVEVYEPLSRLLVARVSVPLVGTTLNYQLTPGNSSGPGYVAWPMEVGAGIGLPPEVFLHLRPVNRVAGVDLNSGPSGTAHADFTGTGSDGATPAPPAPIVVPRPGTGIRDIPPPPPSTSRAHTVL